jgi:hypothetical protein
MTEPNPTESIEPSAPPKRSSNTVVYVIAAIFVLCCLCFGALGLIIAFWQPILFELGLA